MIDWHMMLAHLAKATGQTLWVVVVSGSLASLLGLMLGTTLFALQCPKLLEKPRLYQLVAIITNTVRAMPFLIFMIAIMPLTRHIAGTAIGLHASIVPLTLAAMPMMGRMVEHALKDLPSHLLETAEALGATRWQMLRYFLWPEAKSMLIRQYTTAWVTLVGYASMCGAIGGGGLGDFAIRYGYQRFDALSMAAAIMMIWLLVQSIDLLGQHWICHNEKGHPHA